MKSPLLAYKSDMRGAYANPRYVKEELVGVKIGEALTKAGTDIFSSLTAPDETDSSGTIATHGLGGGEYKGFGGGMREINLPEIPDVNTNLTNPNDFSRFTGSEVPDLVSKGKAERNIKTVNGKKVLTHEANADKLGYKKGTKERTDFINASTEYNKLKYKTDEPTKEGKANNYITMKGSPNKLIGDTMDPYGQINPGAVPPNQAQNDLGAQPIISADGSQPSNRSIDMSAISDPYSALGADFGAGTRNKAQSIYGSAGQRQGLMNLGTPLHDKGHANDYEGHTHRKKGGSYKEGDYMDETDMETSYPKLYTQDVGEIKRDKKSQFMVSKNEDYNPTKIDTIRPSKGKEFKMTWGDAERNISTNPKYKKSN
jgi:hypothetical protein